MMSKKRAAKKAQWQTKDGDVLFIRDMADSHVVNCVNFMARQAPLLQIRDCDSAMRASTLLRGDMATYYAERDLDAALDMDPLEYLYTRYPVFKNMVLEANFREILPEEYEWLLDSSYQEDFLLDAGLRWI